MRLALALVALAQALAITAAPTKLSARDASVEPPEGDPSAKYLADYGVYGDPNGGGASKNIEKREADADPEITDVSEHFLACYSSYGPGPWTDDETDIIKRCAKERLKRDPQYTNYSDTYAACYVEYGTELTADRAYIEKRCGKLK